MMKEKTKQLPSSGETRKTNRTWHFLSTLNSLLLSKLLLLLIIPVMGTANAWGDFSLGSPSATTYSVDKTTLNLVNGTHATFSGGTVSAVETGGSSRAMIGASSTAKFTLYKKTYFMITLSEALAAGDVISITPVSENSRTYYVGSAVKGTQASMTTTKNSTAAATYTITAGHALIGKTTIYLHQNDESSAFNFTAFSITRSGGGSTYTVSFADGTCGDHGTYTGTSKTQASAGASITLPTVAADTGYSFSGWYTNNNGTGTQYASGASMTPTSTHTLYAWYAAKTYTITLNKGTGGSANGSATATYNSNTLTSVTHATHASQTLDGYYTESSGGDKVINADGSLVASVTGYTGAGGIWTRDGATTLYAQWTSGGGGGTVTFTYGSSISESPATTLSSTSNATSSSSYHQVGNGKTITIDGGGNTITSVTVTYSRYGAGKTTFTPTGGSTTTAWSVSNNTGTWEGTATSVTITGTTDSGSDRISQIVVTYSSGGTVKYAVTYNGNGNTGGSVPVDGSSPYNSGVDVTVLGNTGSLVKTGYQFNGWNTAADGSGTPYAAGATIEDIDRNTTLYAQWTLKTYTVTLAKNGGIADGSASVTYNGSSLTSLTAPTRAGHIITGYYTEAGLINKVADAEGNLLPSVDGYTTSGSKWIYDDEATLTLYTEWEPIYTVTFDATTNGGTCATATLTQETSGADIILPAATKEGCNFSGWYTESAAGTRIGGAGDTYEPTANITLYAQFAAAVSTTKFSMVRKGNTDAELASGAEYTLTGSEATITGANATGVVVKNLHSDPKQYLSKSNSGCFLLPTNQLYFEINLSTALAQGDVISFTGYGSKELCFTTSDTYDNTVSSSEYTYTVPSGSALIGATKIYVWRTSPSSTYFNNLTITTSGSQATTHSISYDLSDIADAIDDATDQTNLPNPLPTPTNVTAGYTFEGWYTDDEFTIRATAGAALGADATLYANYTMDAPTISQNGGAIYAGTAMSMTGDAPFTQIYSQWKGDDGAFSKATAINNPGSYKTYDGEAIDTYNFTVPTTKHGTRYFAYMITDGKFYSVPAVTSAFTVNHLITITQPKGATYVMGASATALTVSPASVTGTGEDVGTLSYLWKKSSDRSSWSDADGTNDEDTYSPSTENTGTTYYKCVVSSNNGAAEVESNVVAIEVNAPSTFTVSFDKGIDSGVSLDYTSQTQGSEGASITLATPSGVGSNYTFAGWYDSDDNFIGGAGYKSYVPSGDITLTAKYNCKVTLATAGGSGTVSAVVKGTSTAVNSGDKVLEGTEITITATPTTVNEFVSWSGAASGTTNPVTIEVSDVTSVTANFSVSEYEELFHTTFITDDGWAEGSVDVLSGSTGNVVEKTIDDTKVTFAGKSGTSYTLNVNTSTNKLKYGGSNLNASAGSSTPNCYMAIHLTGVNGSITVDFGSSSQKWIYALDDGSTGTITTGKTQLGSAVSSFTIDNLKNDKVTLYLGQKGVTISELTITTPKTKLTADPTELNFIGTASDALVKITTNSPGDVTATSNNTSVATVTYDGGTKKVTVHPLAKGETTVTVRVAKSDTSPAYPAKEIEIPVTVADPEITISTQPSNLAFYQNDAAAKTFTVSASANTGAELSYQWYTCNSSGVVITKIAGAIEPTYTLNTTQKATVGTTYYKCEISTPAGDACPDKYTNVVSVTVSALDAGGTYNATVYVADPGKTLTYTGLSATDISSGKSTSEFSATLDDGTLTITASAVGSNSIVLDDGTTINVTVKKHVIKLTWTAEKKQYTVTELSAKGITEDKAYTIDNGDHPENLPYLIRQYENGTPYTGVIDFYSDDVTIAYFGDEGSDANHWKKPDGSSAKPTIRYGGGQGGCKFYAYVPDDNESGVEAIKASYDLRIINGYSNDLPSGRKVEVQQQYTLYIPNTDTKLVTVTYGGYKYNNAKWSKGTDSWGTATNYVGKDNVIDGYAYAVRNKDNDAADEYEHAIQVEDDFGSAWYSTDEVSPKGGKYAAYQRIKPFRLPCRASYLTFTAHKSGTLTAYVYQNGIIGRGTNANQLSSGPRLGYWFDEEGWVQQPSATVVTKQKIANANARNKRIYDGKTNDQQMTAYWTNTGDDIMIKKLRSHWCSVERPNKDTPATAFTDEAVKPEKSFNNPYYWGNDDEISANNDQVVPTPETPVPHQGGHMIVNEGYVKYTIDVVAGHTYYFFGKMTKVGYAGMNFVPADDSEHRQTERVNLDAVNDDWSTAFGKTSGTRLKGNATTIYDEITVPSNYRIGKWNTICLPFAVNENQVEQVFGKGTELAIFNGLRHDTENHVYYIKYLRHVDQNILPGQPYLIYPTGRAVAERSNQDNGGMAETGENVPTDASGILGSTVEGQTGTRLTFKNVIINKGITAQSYGCNVDADGKTTSYVFKGTDAPADIVKYDIYNTPKTGALKRYMPNPATNTMKLNTYHAFIQASDSKIQQDAITFAFTEDDIEKSWDPTTWRSEDDDVDPGEATGIVIIEDVTDGGNYSNAGRATNGKTYNMMGQEVDSTSAKGIVIKNGKKVMY